MIYLTLSAPFFVLGLLWLLQRIEGGLLRRDDPRGTRWSAPSRRSRERNRTGT
jgi:hypothetical protein